MSIVVIDGIEYCVENDEDDGDNSNKPSSESTEV